MFAKFKKSECIDLNKNKDGIPSKIFTNVGQALSGKIGLVAIQGAIDSDLSRASCSGYFAEGLSIKILIDVYPLRPHHDCFKCHQPKSD